MKKIITGIALLLSVASFASIEITANAAIRVDKDKAKADHTVKFTGTMVGRSGYDKGSFGYSYATFNQNNKYLFETSYGDGQSILYTKNNHQFGYASYGWGVGKVLNDKRNEQVFYTPIIGDSSYDVFYRKDNVIKDKLALSGGLSIFYGPTHKLEGYGKNPEDYQTRYYLGPNFGFTTNLEDNMVINGRVAAGYDMGSFKKDKDNANRKKISYAFKGDVYLRYLADQYGRFDNNLAKREISMIHLGVKTRNLHQKESNDAKYALRNDTTVYLDFNNTVQINKMFGVEADLGLRYDFDGNGENAVNTSSAISTIGARAKFDINDMLTLELFPKVHGLYVSSNNKEGTTGFYEVEPKLSFNQIVKIKGYNLIIGENAGFNYFSPLEENMGVTSTMKVPVGITIGFEK